LGTLRIGHLFRGQSAAGDKLCRGFLDPGRFSAAHPRFSGGLIMIEIDRRQSDGLMAKIKQISDLERVLANLGVSFMTQENAGQLATTPEVLDHVIAVLKTAAKLKREPHRMHMIRPDLASD
jgi:hypothetical protein